MGVKLVDRLFLHRWWCPCWDAVFTQNPTLGGKNQFSFALQSSDWIKSFGGRKKPSRNYQRLGISLLPGTCKFSFSFKLRALWRMQEGFPLQGSCSVPHSSSASPHHDQKLLLTWLWKGGKKVVELILSSLRTPPVTYPKEISLPSKLKNNETRENLHSTFPEEIQYTLKYSGTIQMQIQYSTVLFIFCIILL